MNSETNSEPGHDQVYVAEVVEVVEVAELVEERSTPWGFWATVGFSVAVLGVFVAVQTAVAIPFVLTEMQHNRHVSVEELSQDLASNGLLLSLAVLLSAPACIGMTVLFAKIRRQMSVRQYLGLRPVSNGAMLLWCSSVLVFMLLSDALTYLVGRDIVPAQMVRAYETAGFLPLLWIAIIIGAPLFEELFFRGFLFQGIRHSKLGGTGAILITALAWAFIHTQYDAYQMSLIFVGGLLLGTARLKTDSAYVTIAMHVFWNIIAVVETAVVVGW